MNSRANVQGLLVVDYLRSKSLNDLATEHGVYGRISNCGLKVSLNYDQIEAKDSDPIAQECRGLVLSRESQQKILTDSPMLDLWAMSTPFSRFFNHGQGAAAKIDWNTARFQEKLDGTMIHVYYDNNHSKWCVGTRSVPDADLPIDGSELTFSMLFKQALKDTLLRKFAGSENVGDRCLGEVYEILTPEEVFNLWTYSFLRSQNTYVFELTGPVNQVVVFYPQPTVTLLGVRSRNTLKESLPKDFTLFVPVVQEYELNSLEQMLEFVSSRSPKDYEGLVTIDNNFNRVKAKNPEHVAYSRIRDSISKSPRALMEIILRPEADDLIASLPEPFNKMAEGKKNKFVDYCHKETEQAKFLVNNCGGNRKTLAMAIMAAKGNMAYTMAVFLKQTPLSFADWVRSQRKPEGYPNSLLDFLNKEMDSQ